MSLCTGIRRSMMCFLLLSGLCSCLHHYHFIAEPKTWGDAQAYCREKYTNLATIDNSEDVERLIAAAGSGYEGNLWIGLQDKPWSWFWSLIELNFYKMEERYFKKWGKGEPNNVNGRGMLCAAFKNGSWCDLKCDERFTFICYDNASTSDMFVYISERKTWEEAKLYCRKNHKDLARVRNDTENSKIQSIVPNNETAWIGLTRHTWLWSDHTHNTFENWADGHLAQFSGSCATSVFNATHTGKWVANHCEETFHFMCHNNKKQIFNVKLAVLKSTTIDPNYPAVTEAILNLIEETMKENGITRDFRIAWVKKPNTNIFHKEEKNAEALNP